MYHARSPESLLSIPLQLGRPSLRLNRPSSLKPTILCSLQPWLWFFAPPYIFKLQSPNQAPRSLHRQNLESMDASILASTAVDRSSITTGHALLAQQGRTKYGRRTEGAVRRCRQGHRLGTAPCTTSSSVQAAASR